MRESGRTAVLVFARSPREDGAAKLRGARQRTAGAAGCDVAALLLAHTLDVAQRAGPTPVLVADAEAARWAPPGLRVLPQRGRAFGDRLRNAVADAFTAGFARVLVVGADVPGLTPCVIRDAAERLEAGDERTVVIGPSSDGGYYLIGFNRFDERAFAGIPWRSRWVLNRTTRALQGSRLSFLPCLTDVDDAGSLRQAVREIVTGGKWLQSELWALLSSLNPAALPLEVVVATPVRAALLPLVRRGPPDPSVI